VALRKPSDIFDKKIEDINIPVVESDSSLYLELSKVESLSEQVSQLQQELSQKVIQTDLEKLVLSQINSMRENFNYLQNDFKKSNKKDISEFKDKVSQLAEIVGNLVEEELPKYKKQVTKNELRIGEKFDTLKEVVEENIVDIRGEIDTQVNNIAEVIDNNLEYFNNQLQETSSKVKDTTDTYNKLSKILESKVVKENEKLEEYSQIIQSLHEEFVELQSLLEEKTSSYDQVIQEKFEDISSDINKKIHSIDEEVDTFKNKVSSEISNIKADVVINEQHIKNVDKYLKENHSELIELKEEVFGEIEKLSIGNLQENLERLEKKIDFIKETYSRIEPEVIVKEVIREGLLNEPPDTKNSDPLTPLDQKFVTLNQLQEHYRLFINRIQQQISTLGGGGETRLKYLDDIVGIATNASAYDGKFLKYNHSIGKFEFDAVSGGGGGGDYANNAGIATSVIGGIGSITQLQVSGISTSAEFVGGGSDLRNLSGTHLVSYASASDISNSALSIAGISTYNQVGILTGSLAVDISDRFGQSVATSADGKTIIVGAIIDEIGVTTGTGVVYVYDRQGNSFNQVGILTGSLAVDTNDNFGYSVATSADGKTIIVGAYNDEIGATLGAGVAYVYDRAGNSFNQVGILTGSLAVDANDFFGTSVATSADGKTIVVGATSDEIGATTGTGAAYVFNRQGNSFNQVGILTGSLAVDTNDLFGISVATSADGKTIIVGAFLDEIGATLGAGVAYVYDRVGSSFNQVGILTGSLAVDANDNFGISVATSADGKTIIVGSNNDEIGATANTGAVYVYDRQGNSFNQVGILTGSYAIDSNDKFGTSVATSADGKTIIVGATQDEIGETLSTGVAYVFNRQGNSFNRVGILTGSLAVDASDLFGISVATSADGKTVIVGANQDEIGENTSSGVVYVFDQTRETYVYSGPTGNIGIGTTNATSKLHVVGDVRVSGIVTANSYSGSGTNLTGIVTSIIAGVGITVTSSTGQFTVSSSDPVLQNPIFTYTSGVLTSILYSSGATKTFTYTSGTLTQIDLVVGSRTFRKTFNYTSGILTSITETEF